MQNEPNIVMMREAIERSELQQTKTNWRRTWCRVGAVQHIKRIRTFYAKGDRQRLNIENHITLNEFNSHG